MSQEKVNRYKEEKANRKKMLRRQKVMNTVRKTVVSVVCVAVLGWIGYSASSCLWNVRSRVLAFPTGSGI